MSIDELCQLIRQCNMAQVRAELQRMKATRDSAALHHIEIIQRFYEDVVRQPK